jgi:hypothetical protein
MVNSPEVLVGQSPREREIQKTSTSVADSYTMLGRNPYMQHII